MPADAVVVHFDVLEHALAFFAEVNWALAESQKESCKSLASSILAKSIKDQNRRAIAVEPDLYRKDKPSPEYEKARQQIRQLDGVADPPPEAKPPASKTGSRSLFGEQARQIERELSAVQRDQLLHEGWTSSAPCPPFGSPQASLAIRGAIEKRLREGMPLFEPDPPGPEPAPKVDLSISLPIRIGSHRIHIQFHSGVFTPQQRYPSWLPIHSTNGWCEVLSVHAAVTHCSSDTDRERAIKCQEPASKPISY